MEFPPFLDVVISPSVAEAERLAALLREAAEAQRVKARGLAHPCSEAAQALRDACTLTGWAHAIERAHANRRHAERAQQRSAQP